MKRLIFIAKLLPFCLIAGFLSCQQSVKEEIFVDFAVNSDETNIEFFWKNNENKPFKSIKNLKEYVEKSGRRLRFAMNGGMYQEDNKPLGLFIQNQKTVTPLNTNDGAGNFYIKPNGVFYITANGKAFLSLTESFKDDGQIRVATQSGPMLLVEGEINKQFTPNSDNLHVRNGVCVLEDSKIIFSISRKEVNFYDFAKHFKEIGCRNALYLDGFVSRMYLPEKNLEAADGDFGVIIGITK